MDPTEKTERVGVDIRIALSSGARTAALKRRQGSDSSEIHLGPSTVRQKIKAMGRRVARAFYRAIKPIVRPIAFRTRAYFSSLLQEEIQQLHLRTAEKLSQHARQQQQLTERLFSRHTADILRTIKESSTAASSTPRGTPAETVAGAHGMAQLIQMILTPGDTFVDVGPGVGAHTLAAARALGEQGRIVAFEPFLPARKPMQIDDVLGRGNRADLIRIATGNTTLQIFEGALGVLESNQDVALIVELGAVDEFANSTWLQFLQGLGFQHAAVDRASGALGENEARTREQATLLFFARPGSPSWARMRGAR